ncbi:hypothetical protein [Hymenobacter rubripertinctus]|uniref:Uncharacterized protein n=1 Tax=Hymenobacter rubripertinctus TaxID=2029981 RepID=A0A418QRJ8_9BACT|nr:hypothetical protein [Hymenobacter rubripertinctus]RIY07722.1 hypothetical protein D0T11_15835 [Hymenobacter rubripertinctus]
MNRFMAFLAQLNRFSYYFIALCFVLPLGCLGYFIFIRTPQFLFTVKDGLLENPQLMGAIGEEAGYNLWYSGNEAPNRTFQVTIKGGCPEASLIVRGTYTDKAHTVTDTVLVKCL